MLVLNITIHPNINILNQVIGKILRCGRIDQILPNKHDFSNSVLKMAQTYYLEV